jgi:hypothetical protein
MLPELATLFTCNKLAPFSKVKEPPAVTVNLSVRVIVDPEVMVRLPDVTVHEHPVTLPKVKLPVPLITIPSEAVGGKPFPFHVVPLKVLAGNTVCVVVTTVEHPDAVLVPVADTVAVAGVFK